MLDTHKIVYVVSFMPSFEGSSVGGFDWWHDEDQARIALLDMIEHDKGKEWTHDYTLRSMPVPKDLSNDQVTELLDTEMREARELPLPAEWESIRGGGGAIDFTDDDNTGPSGAEIASRQITGVNPHASSWGWRL
jgi:hypothetical protein